MGRKREPPELKVLKGTDRPDRENPHAPPAIPLRPELEPPGTLNDVGRAKWSEVLSMLQKTQVLGDQDLHNLEFFCMAYQNAVRAQASIETEGLTVPSAAGTLKKNPAVSVLKEMMGEVQRFGSNLGLDPASRSRLVVGVGGKREVPDNPFATIGRRAGK